MEAGLVYQGREVARKGTRAQEPVLQVGGGGFFDPLDLSPPPLLPTYKQKEVFGPVEMATKNMLFASHAYRLSQQSLPEQKLLTAYSFACACLYVAYYLKLI